MVTIRDLHFAYGRKPVFSGLNLDLKPGHIYGLLGRNGTGKSTLLRIMAGLLFPGEGRISVGGFKPGKRQPAFLQRIFLVPEEFYLPAITIKQWLRYNAPFYPLFNEEQFSRHMRDLEVPEDIRLDEMSYGQRKKALIGFGLATNAALLLMDEPTNGLDIVSKSQFRKVIAGALDDEKCIIISTHQIKDLENLIDRVTVIDEGRILFDQTIDRISSKLDFRLSFDPDEAAVALYSEISLGGNALVLAGTGETESRPDLEMLYKAIVTDHEKVNNVFKRQNN